MASDGKSDPVAADPAPTVAAPETSPQTTIADSSATTATASTTATTATAPDSNAEPQNQSPVDNSRPEDFEGEIATTNELPSKELIKKIENYMVLDRDGKSHTFKSLYNGPNVARRVLVIFVRHFFCGQCQQFLSSLSESITTDMLLRLPVSTFITVIGCGEPQLIQMYADETKCPFPIYTDPTRSLFKALDMTSSWDAGARPAYANKGLLMGTITSLGKALKQVPKGNALKSGNFSQVGGEFLFEPVHMDTPMSSPQHEVDEAGPAEEKRMTWCHRMKTTRDHAEVPELMEILGLDGQGQPIKDAKRWQRALTTRKGTGLSMASEMNQRIQE